MKRIFALAVILLAAETGAAQSVAPSAAPLPLPDGPVVVLISDVQAFDRALSGGFRKALTGELPSSDPVAAGWRQTRVGGKLESQWALFTKDLPLDWNALMKLQPSEIGITLLSVGDLETVLALRTASASAVLRLPAGTEKTHRGAAYRVVARGAGDQKTALRRMGLAWAESRGILLIATSERALQLALDRSLAGQGAAGFLPGLVSMKLDVEALRKDLYFRREFLFAEGLSGPEKGTIRAALRSESDTLVEVREGSGAIRPAAGAWKTDGRDVVAAGWETDPSRFFMALRRGFLESVPEPKALPVASLMPLPDANATAADPYLVDLTRPLSDEKAGGEPGELPEWAAHLKEAPVDGWGWEIARGGARRLVVKRPADDDARFVALALATATRRAGAARAEKGELRVGPDLPAFAWERRGSWLWIAASREDLAGVVEPASDGGLVRWSQLDLAAVAREGKDWTRAEGVFSPDRARPFSDRILGLLGWAPKVSAIFVERRAAPNGWTERVVLTSAP